MFSVCIVNFLTCLLGMPIFMFLNEFFLACKIFMVNADNVSFVLYIFLIDYTSANIHV